MTINEINNIKNFINLSQTDLIDIIYFLRRENNFNLHNANGANNHMMELLKEIATARDERDIAVKKYDELLTGHNNIIKKLTRKLTVFERLSGNIDLRN